MREFIKSSQIALILCIIIFFNLLLINSVTAQTWQITSIPTSETQRSIHFMTAGEGWSAGYNGTILHTIDGGNSWSLQTSNTSERFLAIRFLDHDIGWAGAGRIIVRTINGGEDWTDIKADTSVFKFRNSLFPVSSKVAWAPACSNGVPTSTRWFSRYTIEDNGTTTEQDFNVIQSSAQFYGIYFIDEDNGWSVGLYGQIIRISNASTDSPSFSYQTSGTSVTLNGVFILDANNGWIVGASGTILKTTDGGTTWSPITSGTSTNLRGVHFINSDKGWVVGDAGLILATEDGGNTWSEQTSGVTTILWSVFISNSGFIAGGDSTGGENGVILTIRAPGFVVSPISNDTTEAGGQATFTVRLTAPPTADVTIGLSSSDTTEGTVLPSSVTFTTANWNVAQTVTATGVDDTIVDGNVAYSIVTAAATSTDSNHNGLNAADVSVTNNDNDTAGKAGDINGDGAVDLRDAVLALQTLSGVIPAGIRTDYASSGADVNGDGKIGMVEVIFILQSLAVLRTE